MDYELEAKDKEYAGIVIKPLTVTGRHTQEIATIAKTEVKSTLKSINEQRPGTIYLIVNYIAHQTINVSELTAFAPAKKVSKKLLEGEDERGSRNAYDETAAFISFDVPENIERPVSETVLGVAKFTIGKKISRNEALVIPITIAAPDRIQPGKHIVVFNIGLAWEEMGLPQKGTLIETHEIDIGILGESEIYKALGVPSFFFLPGFLMVLTWWGFWRFGLRLSEDQEEFPMKPKNSLFWFLVITLSFLSAWGYASITGHDHLEAYSYRDLTIVWGSSIVAGIIIYLGIATLQLLWKKKIRPRWKVRTTISVGDRPIAVLEKLERFKLSVDLSQVTVKLRNKSRFGYLTTLIDGLLEDDVKYVVIPKISVKFVDPPFPERKRLSMISASKLNKN